MKWKKIAVRMWNDEKFLRLSPAPPNGQTLWSFLLTNDLIVVPGCIVAGEATLADVLRWPLKGFREAFREVLREGLAKADFERRFIWIPNALRYDPPQSPNVSKHWAKCWDDLPDCELKYEAFQHFKAFHEGLGGAFMKAFEKASCKPFERVVSIFHTEPESLPEPLPEPFPKETYVALARRSTDVLVTAASEPEPLSPEQAAVLEVFAHYRTYHPRSFPQLPKRRSGKRNEVDQILDRLSEGWSVEDLRRAIDGCHRSPHHQGANPLRTKYDSLELIVRDSKRVQQFIDIVENPPQVIEIDPRSARHMDEMERFMTGRDEGEEN